MLAVIDVRQIPRNIRLENGEMAGHDLYYAFKIIMKDSSRKEPVHYVMNDEIIFRYSN